MRKFRGRSVISTVIANTGTASGSLVVPWTVAIPLTLGVRVGAASDGVVVGGYTYQAVDNFFLFDSPSYSDDTTDINDADASDVALLPATETTSDACFFGQNERFATIKITIGTAGVVGGTALTSLLWKYWNGSSFVTLEAAANIFLDSSASFTAGTSTYVISFIPPSDWAKTTVDSVEAYWIQATCAVADFTTTPLATRAYIGELKAATGLRCPVGGTITGVMMHATTLSAANGDTEFMLVNVTKGTVDGFTWTKATPCDYDTTLSMTVSEGDELMVQVMQQDGSTEFANASLIFEITAS